MALFSIDFSDTKFIEITRKKGTNDIEKIIFNDAILGVLPQSELQKAGEMTPQQQIKVSSLFVESINKTLHLILNKDKTILEIRGDATSTNGTGQFGSSVLAIFDEHPQISTIIVNLETMESSWDNCFSKIIKVFSLLPHKSAKKAIWLFDGDDEDLEDKGQIIKNELFYSKSDLIFEITQRERHQINTDKGPLTVTMGSIYKGIGTSGETKDREVTGMLTEIRTEHSHAILDGNWIKYAVNPRTLQEI